MARASSPSPQSLDAQICFSLYKASRAMTRTYGVLLAPLKLTYPQYLAMLTLWEQDGISVRELGDRLGLDSATLTPLLSRLESRGLVKRQRDAEDARVVRLYLSPEGRAMKSKAGGVPFALACRAGFDPKNAVALSRLERLRAQLNTLTETLMANETLSQRSTGMVSRPKRRSSSRR
jgi:DNA-binding MarR family transcriptional regulator